MFSSRRLLVAVPLSGLVLGSPIRLITDNDSIQKNATIKKYRQTIIGTIRACRLLATVTTICLDYGQVIYKQRYQRDEDISEFDKVSNEIVRLRNEHEKVSALRWKHHKDMLDKDEEVCRVKAEELYQQINLLSERCGTLQSSFAESHMRSAVRLHSLCEKNGGVYIKLGQHISQLDYLFPKEFISILRKLLNDTPRSSYESVRSVIKEELGKYPEEIWAEFEREPVASASLAQVHVARDQEGRKYAVKVQHEDLQGLAESDILAVSMAVDIVAKMFEDFDYNWLARELQMNLPQELDFQQEAANLRRCGALLDDLIQSGDLAVPEVFAASRRVLVMSFEEGSYITNHEAMATLGVPLTDIANTIARTFCEQIFRHGFVHCDPHLANVLVRQHPKNNKRAQIVLLDHGLYRQLDDEFRMNYCRLWKALVTFNRADVETYCRKMNAGDMYPLLSSILTLSAWDDVVSGDIGRLRNKASGGHNEKMKTYAQRYMHQINKLMQSVPSSLLLLLKTNDCLRTLDKEIGSPVNTLMVTADVSSRVVLQDDVAHCSSWSGYWSAYTDYYQVQLTVLGFSIVSYFLTRK